MLRTFFRRNCISSSSKVITTTSSSAMTMTMTSAANLHQSFTTTTTSIRFCSTTKTGDGGKSINYQDESDNNNEATNTLHVTDQDLNLGNDMPPLLQYNENLVASALRLVEYANKVSENSASAGDIEITPEMEAGIANIMAMLFHEEYIPLVDQFQAVRELALMEGFRKSPVLLEAIHDITAALVPDPIMGLIRFVDPDVEGYSYEAIEDINRFIVLILEGQESDDDFVHALQTMQNRNPQLDQSTPFIVLMQKMNDVLLQSRLAYLLTEACLTFDPERTGKIKTTELEESLLKILPKEAVSKMMEHIEGDDKGCVSYAQMGRILLKGDQFELLAEK